MNSISPRLPFPLLPSPPVYFECDRSVGAECLRSPRKALISQRNDCGNELTWRAIALVWCRRNGSEGSNFGPGNTWIRSIIRDSTDRLITIVPHQCIRRWRVILWEPFRCGRGPECELPDSWNEYRPWPSEIKYWYWSWNSLMPHRPIWQSSTRRRVPSDEELKTHWLLIRIYSEAGEIKDIIRDWTDSNSPCGWTTEDCVENKLVVSHYWILKCILKNNGDMDEVDATETESAFIWEGRNSDNLICAQNSRDFMGKQRVCSIERKKGWLQIAMGTMLLSPSLSLSILCPMIHRLVKWQRLYN